MPLVEFSERDLKRGTVVEPDWYRVHIDEIDAEGTASKDGKSINYTAEGTILFNGNNGDTKYRGVPVTWNFNSKILPSLTKGLFESCGLELKAGERYRLEACSGREVDIYVENEPYQGRILNRINHKYRRPKEEVVAQS